MLQRASLGRRSQKASSYYLEFRQVRWLAIPYVTLFYAATGGMIGVAAQAGRVWTVGTVMSFLAMTVLSLVQHSITGQ